MSPAPRPFLTACLLALILASPSAAERVLLCLGDSLTAGYGLDESQAWPALLQARLDRQGLDWRVINAGVSGDTTAGGLQRLDWLLKAAPDAAYVCLGANDGLRGVATSETRRNLKAILRRLKGAGVRVFLGGMDLPLNLGDGYRREFRAIFPALAKEEAVPLQRFLLEGVGGVKALNQADGMHPTAEGQAIVEANVARFLMPYLGGTAKAAETAAPSGRAPKVLRRRSDLKP